MQGSSWLQRRGSRYYYRLRVPAYLVDILGKAEVRRSLHTSNPAEARRLVRAAAAEVQVEFDRARAREDGNEVTPQCNDDMLEIAEVWLSAARALWMALPESRRRELSERFGVTVDCRGRSTVVPFPRP